MSGVTGFIIAVGIVSLICFALMRRTDRVRDRRRAYANSSASDTCGGISSGNASFGLLNWFGASSSSTSEDTCTSSSSSFFSGSSGDSSCGDGGGGGGGGGGGD